MARIFNILITSGTSHSDYTIYYDLVGPSNIATRVSTTLPATGVTYNDLITEKELVLMKILLKYF